jgi:hypothetical protein
MSVDWTAIRTDYENGLSLRQLAAKYDVSKTYIIEKRNKENWNRPDRPTTDRPLSSQRVSNPPTRDVNAVNRVALALKLRAQKLTYEEIARRAGYGSASACRKAIQRELQRIVVENVEELRREEANMYDIGHSECWLLFMDRTNTWRLTAWDRILATSIERRKLLGLDKKIDDVPGPSIIIQEVPAGYLEGPKE